MSSIHYQRAKNWGTNAWVAEWFAKAVAYVKTPEGRIKFQKWAYTKFGPSEAPNIIKATYGPIIRRYGKATGNAEIWYLAGLDLGVSDNAMKHIHQFTSEYRMCEPERVKPAIKRRRGESPVDWLARKHDSLLLGCKVPNFDWQTARATAISELDKTRDTIEVWRTQPELFFLGIKRRGESTIPSPEIANRPSEYKRSHSMDDAFRTRLYFITMAHMTWSHACALFEELATRGLTTASSLERAYKQDSQLLWNVVSCFARVHQLRNIAWGRLTHIVSWCEAFRPYFKRWRDERGVAHIRKNKSYINSHAYNGSFVDEAVVQCMVEDGPGAVSFFSLLAKAMQDYPDEMRKFSTEAFDEIGDFSIIDEFNGNVEHSPFGQNLCNHVHQMDAAKRDHSTFLKQVTPIDPIKLNMPRIETHPTWGSASLMIANVAAEWMNCTWRLTIWDDLPNFNSKDPITRMAAFDAMWAQVDSVLWAMAGRLDRSNERGRVAKEFGLFDVTDPKRPTYCATILQRLNAEIVMVPNTTPAPVPSPYVENIPIARPTDSVSKSGHAYLRGSVIEGKPKVKSKGQAGSTEQRDAPSEVATETVHISTSNITTKKKTKTKAVSAAEPTNEGHDVEDEMEEDDVQRLPDALPATFTIGKKVMEVFHRILKSEDPEDKPVKKGVLRWAEFEHGMKRISFTVIQAAGLAVRFDPPAKTARPISFHRPHPDSVLHPIMMSWIGARLRRVYGWTTDTFQQFAPDPPKAA